MNQVENKRSKALLKEKRAEFSIGQIDLQHAQSPENEQLKVRNTNAAYFYK
ncbi:hypothetical protein [Brevibacillus sp. SIMBA_076]|uniref:hypothetical protein n=1 Tax=Brevibacillus sp. SIMBA_076 TaxID=3085814 RepID=UPI00397E103C